MPMSNDHDPIAGTDPEELVVAEPLRPQGAPVWTPDASSGPAPSDGPVTFTSRTSGPSKLRVGAVAGAAVALAVGAVATSLAATPPTPTTTTAISGVTDTSRAAGSAGQVDTGWFTAVGPVAGGGQPDTFDHGMMGGRGFHDITVSAISGTNVTLKTDDGWTRTIAVTGSVKVTKGGQEIALSELSVGDQVRIDQTRNADGTYTVDALVVVVPTISGTVSDLSSSGFKVTNRDGSVWTITVNGSTVYKFGTGTGSLSDVKNGGEVLVQGETTADNAMTALTVQVPADRASGTVKSKTSDTIVITKRDGTTVTVHVDSGTSYRVAGVATAKLSDVAVDMAIGVSGRQRSDGSIDADVVIAGQGGFRGMGGMDGDIDGDVGGMFGGMFGGFGGRGGHGGFGPGMGDDGNGTTPATPTPSPTTSS